MKFFDRRAVEDTSPKVYIGRRIFINRQGREQVTAAWFAECSHRGRTVCTPLKTESLSVAVHRAHQLAERLRELPHLAPARRAMELPELAREYLTMQHNRGRAPRTLASYELCLACFVAWTKPRFSGPAHEFTAQLFWQFNRAMIEDGYAPKTRSVRLILIKQMLKWAARKRLIPSNPLEDETIVEPKPTPQPCFEPAQVAVLLDKAPESLDRALYATLAYAGLRFGEARALRWINVVMPRDGPGHLCIAEGGSNGTTKDKETRRIPLHPELRRLLELLPRRGELVFYSPASRSYPRGDRPLNQSTWLRRLKDLCAKCGFVNPGQYKLHTFRHAFASMCARNNVAYRYALAWMGHSSSQILDLYLRQFDDVADTAMRTINYPTTSASPPRTAPSHQNDSEDRLSRGTSVEKETS